MCALPSVKLSGVKILMVSVAVGRLVRVQRRGTAAAAAAAASSADGCLCHRHQHNHHHPPRAVLIGVIYKNSSMV